MADIIRTKKISELDAADSLDGFVTVGYKEVNGEPVSKKIDLSFVSQAAAAATQASQAAQAAASEMLAAKKKGVSMDFGENEDTISWLNMFGDLHVKAVVASNCATVKLSYGSVSQQAVTPGTVDIAIPAGATLTWDITRTTANQKALLAFQFLEDVFIPSSGSGSGTGSGSSSGE